MKSFKILEEWYNIVKNFPQEIKEKILCAFIDYAFEGEVFTDDPIALNMFEVYKPKIDVSRVRSAAGSILTSKKYNQTQNQNGNQNGNQIQNQNGNQIQNQNENQIQNQNENQNQNINQNGNQNQNQTENQTENQIDTIEGKETNEKESISPHPIYKEKENKEKEDLLSSHSSKSVILSQSLFEQSVEIPKDKIPYSEIQSIWNTMSKEIGISSIRLLTETRKKQLRVRWIEWGAEEIGSMETFKLICSCIKESSYLRGSKGWKVDIDFVIKNSTNWVKIIEGNYKDNVKTSSTEKTSNNYNNEDIW